MTELSVIKEKIKNFYAAHEVFLRPVMKFILSFISLILIKFNIGSGPDFTSWIIIAVISVLMAFLPFNVIVIGLLAYILINVYIASIEVGLLMTGCLVVMLIVFYMFVPEQGLFLLMVPLATFLKIPYIIPVAAGLIYGPSVLVSVTFGTLICFMITTLGSATVTSDGQISVAGANLIINNIISNKEMYLTMAAFIITTVVVYLIRRTSRDYAWMVAITAGTMVDFVIILVGSLVLGIESSIPALIFGHLASLLIAAVLNIWLFSVDYQRTEYTQFEDDEYYYYVKAVPKVNVSAPDMNVKRINAQRTRKKKKTDR